MKNKKLSKTNIVLMFVTIAALLVSAVSGCGSGIETGTNQDGESREASHSESGDEGGGEESGNALTLDQTYDTVRKGTRLIMVYDPQSNAFVGTVENTTNSTLQQVRVEVHLSNGVELGPTTPVDLAPGETIDVTLAATDQVFDGWSAHAEVGPGSGGEAGEHGLGGEGGGEHGPGKEGSKEGGEHGGGEGGSEGGSEHGGGN